MVGADPARHDCSEPSDGTKTGGGRTSSAWSAPPLPVPWTFVSAPSTGSDFGTNSWLVEEMYEQFREDPASVGEAWREFFADYKSSNPALAAHASAPAPVEPDDEPVGPPASPTGNGATEAVPPA